MVESVTLSKQAKDHALKLHGLIFVQQNPQVWSAQRMTAPEVLGTGLTVAGQYFAKESDADTVCGALLTALAWVAYQQSEPVDTSSAPTTRH